MSRIRVSPRNISKKAKKLGPGDTLVLKEGVYDDPIIFSELRGTWHNPILIEAEAGALVSSTYALRDEPATKDLPSRPGYNRRANEIARLRQEGGFYPSIGQTFEEASISLYNCQYVIIRGLEFGDCWPTAIYIDRSQNVGVLNCNFIGGCLAIGANGIETRDLLVENCTWDQDPTGSMWNEVRWDAIHGSYENARAAVDLENDVRAWDGDFFRGWSIAGNAVFRGNSISNAFNGIHFFNDFDDLDMDINANLLKFNNGRQASANILIENNTFTRIKDNCVEPEDYAWNWVVRGNTFANCNAVFSFELKRAGWFYVYCNQSWSLDWMGVPEDKDPLAPPVDKTGASGFKCGGQQLNEGDIYVFNNSWLQQRNERLLQKRRLGRLKHRNNAVDSLKPGKSSRFFGKNWFEPNESKDTLMAEGQRFTRRWEELGIEMDGDIVNDPYFPEKYRQAAYPLGPMSQGGKPGFTKTKVNRKAGRPDLTILKGSPGWKSSIAWTMRLPGWQEAARVDDGLEDRYDIEIPAGWNIGADISQTQRDYIDRNMTFLPGPICDPQLLLSLVA